MTKINRVSIQGFKSFAHKIDIPFGNEFNCILGPNGAGKSNLGDALCFVLGRISAKSMRAEKAANLIFNGGKNKKPAASGSVEIAFCNKNKIFPLEEQEVVINRTITKKCGSIYKVNNKKQTRTEVLDLLSNARINPDGYNIILQGDITRFVDMSPLERRRIIEEISDVSIYEDKKNKSLLELKRVDEKLNNAGIILKERGTYLKELKKDRDQALKFKDLKDKIASYKATYLHLKIKDLESSNASIKETSQKHQSKLTESETKINQLKEKVSTAKEEMLSMNKEIEQKGEKEQVKVHKEIEDLKISITKDKARTSTLKDEINKIQQRKDQFTQELEELNKKSSSYGQQEKDLDCSLTRKQKELLNIENSIEQFKKKHKIETSKELDSEIETKDQLIEQKQEEVQSIRHKQQELLREKDKVEYQLETINERINKVKEVAQQNKDQIKILQENKNNFKSASLKLNQCLDKDSSFASQIGNARNLLVELQERHANLQAKSLSMQAHLASNQAVKAILDNKREFKGVHGTVAELGQVKKKYATALETTAGAKLQQIIVDNDQTASECIKYLKSNKLGSASFIPLNKIKSQTITLENKTLLKESGAHDFALNLVSFKPKFKNAFQHVFGNSLIVEDLNVARKVGVGKIKMATLDGDISESSGVMRGGFRNKRPGLGFKEQDSIEGLEKVESEINELQSVLSNVQNKRETNEQEISSLRNLKSELEADIIKLEKTLHLEGSDMDASSDLKKELNSKLKEIDNELSQVQKTISTVNRDLSSLKSKKQILRNQVNELRNPRLLAQLQAFEESRQKYREDIVKLESELKNGATQMKQLVAPEKEKIVEIMKQHEKEVIKFTEEISKINERIITQESQLQDKDKASKDFYSKYRALFAKREKLTSEVNTSENEIENIREKVRNHERELNLFSLKNAEFKAKLAGLQEEFSRVKDAPILKNRDSQELKVEMSRYEVMMEQMSAVNMKALEVYEQVEKEFKNLIEKKNGLHSEKTDVLTLMNEIETKKKDHFMKTFIEANKNFTKIFTNLFKKGSAYLQLDNPEKPFEDGLSVKVKVNGNRYMDIKSLSGGEKTLTALSFIFAIQEHQPASFYILDEIDAALDKHNAERLSKLIRDYSNKAQYVVISHNDSLISEADTLFGVSMKEGVSKVTSLKI
jgi:chromosome segregation protein